MTRTGEPRRFARLLRRTLVAATLILSIGLAGATPPAASEPKPNPAAARKVAAKHELSFPVKRRTPQPDLSPELMHDLPEANPKRDESTSRPASDVSVPFLRGVYTGAAKTFIQSNGKSRIVWLEVTGYCPCTKCCGPEARGITASGKPVTYRDGAFAAADWDQFPFGTKLRVPGYRDGKTVEVVDKGSAIKGARLDVFFATHEEAEAWGRQWVAVVVDR